MILGTNNGCFYRLKVDRLSNVVIDTVLRSQIDALEFACCEVDMVSDLLKYKIPDNKLKFKSLHTPFFHYQNDQKTNFFLKLGSQVSKLHKLDNIVFHPDQIIDWNVFKKFDSLPLSIENMDQNKSFGNKYEDIKSVLDNNSNFNLVIDLSHCYEADPSMKLAEKLYNDFQNRVVEFHLSGSKHLPFFETQETIILDFLHGKNKPIILESVFSDFKELDQEIKYIKNYLKII